MFKTLILSIFLLFSINVSFASTTPKEVCVSTPLDTTQSSFFYKVIHLFNKHKDKIKYKKYLKKDTASFTQKSTDTLGLPKSVNIDSLSSPYIIQNQQGGIQIKTPLDKIINDTINTKSNIIYIYNSQNVNINISPNSSIIANKYDIKGDPNNNNNNNSPNNSHKMDPNRIISIITILVATIPVVLTAIGLSK